MVGLPLLGNGPFYPLVVKFVGSVANRITKFLMFLQKQEIVDRYKDVHLIGLSLGAHVAGATGYKIKNETNFSIGRITGLDPAGNIYVILIT
jgi:hypothetical protein